MAGTPGSGGPLSGAYGVLPGALDTPRPGRRHERRPWDQYRDWSLDNPDMVSWGDDPRFVARRLEHGSWAVIKHSRNDESVLATPRDDDEMVLLLIGRQWTPAYPFASETNATWIRALEEAAAPLRASWSRHSELPYLAVFNSRRSPAPPAP